MDGERQVAKGRRVGVLLYYEEGDIIQSRPGV